MTDSLIVFGPQKSGCQLAALFAYLNRRKQRVVLQEPDENPRELGTE